MHLNGPTPAVVLAVLWPVRGVVAEPADHPNPAREIAFGELGLRRQRLRARPLEEHLRSDEHSQNHARGGLPALEAQGIGGTGVPASWRRRSSDAYSHVTLHAGEGL